MDLFVGMLILGGCHLGAPFGNSILQLVNCAEKNPKLQNALENLEEFLCE